MTFGMDTTNPLYTYIKELEQYELTRAEEEQLQFILLQNDPTRQQFQFVYNLYEKYIGLGREQV